jgi:hypothetical protein
LEKLYFQETIEAEQTERIAAVPLARRATTGPPACAGCTLPRTGRLFPLHGIHPGHAEVPRFSSSLPRGHPPGSSREKRGQAKTA